MPFSSQGFVAGLRGEPGGVSPLCPQALRSCLVDGYSTDMSEATDEPCEQTRRASAEPVLRWERGDRVVPELHTIREVVGRSRSAKQLLKASCPIRAVSARVPCVVTAAACPRSRGPHGDAPPKAPAAPRPMHAHVVFVDQGRRDDLRTVRGAMRMDTAGCFS